jgi:hypothetical protein
MGAIVFLLSSLMGLHSLFFLQSDFELRSHPEQTASPPDWVTGFNTNWRAETISAFDQQQKNLTRAEKEIQELFARKNSTALLTQMPSTEAQSFEVRSTYLLLPELHVDITPDPKKTPPLKAARFSWPLTLKLIRSNSVLISKLETQLVKIQRQRETLADKERDPVSNQGLALIVRLWAEIRENSALIAARIRYLETWNLSLPLNEPTTRETPISPMGRSFYKPTRDKKSQTNPMPWLSERGDTVVLQVTTDIQDEQFLSDWRAAIEIHWNQSPWAKRTHKKIIIELEQIDIDHEFKNNSRTLEEHLSHHFQKDRAILTTGGKSLVVYGRAMVLSPGKIRLRTLAHEIGHLLGFRDCYYRTLESWGPFGTAVLEYSNPYFPNELMCNSESGINDEIEW